MVIWIKYNTSLAFFSLLLISFRTYRKSSEFHREPIYVFAFAFDLDAREKRFWARMSAFWIVLFLLPLLWLFCVLITSIALSGTYFCAHTRTHTYSHELPISLIASPLAQCLFWFFPSSSFSSPRAINCFCAFSALIIN